MSLNVREMFSRSEHEQDIDWGLCFVRWGLLGFVPILTLLDPAQRLLQSDLLLVLFVFGIYSLLVSLLLFFRLLSKIVPPATIVLDTVGIAALLYVSGGTDSLFFFYPLFPIATAAVRYGWRPGLASAGVFVLAYGVQVVLLWQDGLGIAQAFEPGMHGLLFVLVAVVGSVLSPSSNSRLSLPARDATRESVVPEQVKLAYEMASTLSATLNYERVLDAILDISRLGFDELGYRMGESVGLVLLYDRDGLLFPASHRGLIASEDETLRIRGLDGIVGQAIASAEARIGGAPVTDPELREFRSLEPCKSMICVPLRAGFETYGIVMFASVRPNIYTVQHLDLLMIFCNQATIALQNATLYQSLREERDKIIDKEEQARHKLARDLHDGPTQDVAAIAMRLNFARLLLDRDPVRARAEMTRLEDLAHRTVREIRSMLFTLRPVILETEGLVAALNQYAENLRANDGLSIEVDAENYRDCLDSEVRGVVFAILEEAMNNAKKHAEASKARVQLAVRGDMFVAQVVDDGRGFDVAAVERNYGSRGSLGMINLKERAELIGGTLKVESSLGHGTRITLIVPLDEMES